MNTIKTRARRILRKLRDGGMSREDAWSLVLYTVRVASESQGWRESETVMALTEWQDDLEVVFTEFTG